MTHELPDVRDGLTRYERIVLVTLRSLEHELERAVPTAMLYGRVIEHVDLSPSELQQILVRLGASATHGNSADRAAGTLELDPSLGRPTRKPGLVFAQRYL